jgi:hypothetical protein
VAVPAGQPNILFEAGKHCVPVFSDRNATLDSEVWFFATWRVTMRDSLPPLAPYPNLSYSQAELQAVMRAHYDKIIDFITSEPFKALMQEMSALSHLERPKFVREVLLDESKLKARGVTVPHGILIQRSAFGDRRPTLFAVKHFLPENFSDVWQNVNITFDNDYLGVAISRDRETCWRAPLPPDVQAQAMVEGADLEKVEADRTIQP